VEILSNSCLILREAGAEKEPDRRSHRGHRMFETEVTPVCVLSRGNIQFELLWRRRIEGFNPIVDGFGIVLNCVAGPGKS